MKTWRFVPNVGTVMVVLIEAESEAEARKCLAFILERTTDWWCANPYK
jgi:hypothetical protein